MTKAILALALAASTIATSASAEIWELYAYKHWSVGYYDEPDNQGCLVGVGDESQSFSVTLDKYGLDGNLVIPDVNYPDGEEGQIVVTVDSMDSWIVQADAAGTSIWFDLDDHRFLDELRAGNKLFIDINGDELIDVWFSLAGSSRALSSFLDCTKNLDPAHLTGSKGT